MECSSVRHKLLQIAATLFVSTLAAHAHAATYQFGLLGSGVSGTINLTYGNTTDTKTPQGVELTGISGNFSDTNIGIVNASITGLVPINHATPETTNLLAPNDFSRFAVASGLDPQSNGFVTYDNLFYPGPGGSPQTASDYPFHGGIVDIYGVLFTLSNGDVVDFWSNGVTPGLTLPDYGVAVVTHATALDYVGGVTAATPEPGTLCLLGTGIAGVLVRRRKSL
jgi:hypothetical protein